MYAAAVFAPKSVPLALPFATTASPRLKSEDVEVCGGSALKRTSVFEAFSVKSELLSAEAELQSGIVFATPAEEVTTVPRLPFTVTTPLVAETVMPVPAFNCVTPLLLKVAPL